MIHKGYWALVLHAHLPYVRHPELPEFMEERWLFEALTECYLPMTEGWQRLRDEGLDYCLTWSVSPPLAAMLTDQLLQNRYLRHLDKLLILADNECKRTQGDPDFAPVARMYREKLEKARAIYRDQWGCQITEAWRSLADSGHLDLWTCSATHCFLPYASEASWRAQIHTGVKNHQRVFGSMPRGFWLPECAYTPGVERILAEAGVECFMVDTGTFQRARPTTANIYEPLHIGHGVSAFARDPETGRQVWDKSSGYPGDYDYREFYRDIGFDLPYEDVAPFLASEVRSDTGFKYYRITGKGDHKEPYNPEWARGKIQQHADNFVFNRHAQIAHWHGVMGKPPIVVSPYDAELFGHWWYEGPDFVEAVLRRVASNPEGPLGLTTPYRYKQTFGQGPDGQISFSTWGEDGFGKVWLSPVNDFIYPYLHRAEREMVILAESYPDAQGEVARCLNQTALELMLAQSSDWAFILYTGTTTEYAKRRMKEHYDLFWKLARSLRQGKVDLTTLVHAEWKHPIFPDVDYRHYIGLQTATVPRRLAPGPGLGAVKGPVWMLSWEYPPRVMGGLGRHVYDLSQTLVEQGVPVRVFTCAVEGCPEFEWVNGVALHRLPVPGRPMSDDFLGWVWRMNFALLEGMMAQIGEETPAVVHAHDWLVAMAAKEFQRLSNRPMVATIHATEHGRQRGIHTELQRYIHGVETELVKIADEVIACSDYMAREISTLFDVPIPVIYAIPNGVDPKAIVPTPGRGRRMDDFKQPGEEVIFYVGRLVSEKGVQVLIEAMPQILAHRPKARLLIAGKGPMDQELRSRAYHLGVAHQVTFAGFVDDDTRNQLLNNADVAVFPSLYEPFGIVALEAMAAKVPVVVSDTGGLGEIIQTGKNGWKVPPGDAGALAHGIVTVLSEPLKAKHMTDEALRQVRLIYAWDAIADQTAQVYAQAIAKADGEPNVQEEQLLAM
ncbi:1,4-alpha-glucan branching protein domain-containing protein [Heliophilum fasciatum]|uniref:1,4-alpha-glucan branching enzyme n=1 Tax=Heliophilum fasciatum TaxID=35700 RepID=A0A4R2RQP3_9FIRM|nr:1,4-alpha-glucan branching protein domain-containing protein [Heliophilum fasciatum]MCW2279088.1 1,4-alpha-glucan branching enzyme [Heliophilum fasciatum]TCP61485.1 1,4-alpha-glucan branching enzyme [Heliophilum fasciatum]